MQNLIEFPLAFFAGLLSFLSPCVLPLLPSYVAILSGSSERKHILGKTFAFVSGFSIIFVVFGIVFSQAGMMIGNHIQNWILIAGMVIIILGINTMVNIFSFLNIEKRFHLSRKPRGIVSSVLFGAAFGAGWSPCVGPLLASILFMAGQGTLGRSSVLLICYSLGLALPFLLAAVFFSRLEGLFKSIKKHLGKIKIVSGILLIIIGLYMMMGKIRLLSGTFAAWGYRLERFSQKNPFLCDAVFSLLYAAVFLVFVSLRIRKRKRLQAEGTESKTAGLALLIIGFIFAVFAILEVLTIISTPEFIASWLRFQGI
jgi:cytochrome c-type biogenesis protein